MNNTNIELNPADDLDKAILLDDASFEYLKTGEAKVDLPTTTIPSEIYSVLESKGLKLEEGEEWSKDTFENKLAAYEPIIVDKFISSAPKITQDLIKYATLLGDKASKETIEEFFKSSFDDFSEKQYDFTAIDEARAYMKEALQVQLKGIDKEDLEIMLDSMEDRGVLETKASEHYAKVKENKALERQNKLKQQEQYNLQVQEENNKFFSTLENELSKVEWSKAKKDQIKAHFDDNITTSKLKAIYDNPSNYFHLLNFLTYFDNGKFDFSQFAKSYGQAGEFRNNIVKDLFNTGVPSNSGSTKPLTSNRTPTFRIIG